MNAFSLSIYIVGAAAALYQAATFHQEDNTLLILCVVMSIFAAAAIAFHFGWAVALTILGPVIGIFFDSPVKSGPIDAQVTQTISCVIMTTIIFGLMGLFLDLSIKNRNNTDASK